jgi:hypothetical protein
MPSSLACQSGKAAFIFKDLADIYPSAGELGIRIFESSPKIRIQFPGAAQSACSAEATGSRSGGGV